MTYHETLAATRVTVDLTAAEARRLADLFARLDSGASTTAEDRNMLTGVMKLRFQRAADRADKHALRKMADHP